MLPKDAANIGPGSLIEASKLSPAGGMGYCVVGQGTNLSLDLCAPLVCTQSFWMPEVVENTMGNRALPVVLQQWTPMTQLG